MDVIVTAQAPPAPEFSGDFFLGMIVGAALTFFLFLKALS